MRKSTICVLALSILMIAVSVWAKVTTDYDHAVSFERYHTYSWVRAPHTANPLMSSRVQDAVNAQLRAKGWQMVTDGADVSVTANGATQQEHTLQTFYNGMDGWRWGGWGTATTTQDNYTVGTLVVDLFDTHGKQLIWRGTASDTLADTPDKNTKKLDDAVKDMFKDFPPKDHGK